MTKPTEEDDREPVAIWLVLKGVLLMVGAFISAVVILVLHAPVGH